MSIVKLIGTYNERIVVYKKVTINLVSLIVRSILSLLLFKVITESATPSEYAPYGASLILIGLMTTVGSIGFGPALIRCDSINESKINTYLSLSGVIGVILSLALCIFSSSLESLLSVAGAQLYFISVSPIIAIKLISMVYEAIAQRELKIAQITKIDFYAFLIFHFVFQVIVLTFGLDLIWLVLCIGLEELSKLLLYKKISNIKYYISFRFQEIKDNLSFSLIVTVNRIINYLNSQIDKIYVSNQLSAADFSGYGRVFQFINFPTNIVGQFFDKVIYPIVCKRLKSSDGRFGFRVFGLVFLMGVLSSFFCLLIGNYVEKFFFSGEWKEYIDIYYILIFLIPIRLLDRYSSVLLNALGKPIIRTISQVVFIISLLIGLSLGGGKLTDIAKVSVFSYGISAIFSMVYLAFLYEK